MSKFEYHFIDYHVRAHWEGMVTCCLERPVEVIYAPVLDTVIISLSGGVTCNRHASDLLDKS